MVLTRAGKAIHTLLTGISAFGIVLLPIGLLASTAGTSAEEARQKINLSGRQRMLSQRMAAASCLAMAGVDVATRAQVAQTAHDDFAKALNGLQFGDADLGLPAETSDAILVAFADVSLTWEVMSPVVRQLSAGDLHSVVVRQLVTENLQLLTRSNAAVRQITEVYGAGVINGETAKTIDIAGRQRMLSQKMMKEACFLAIGLSLEESAAKLKETMELFDTSLTQLINGDETDGVMRPPSRAVEMQLEKVASLWEVYQTRLSVLQPDSATSMAELEHLAGLSDSVLAEMHKAVLLYVSDSG